MGIKDYMSGMGEKFRNYFSRGEISRGETVTVLNDERGRNAQVGYLQRRNWFDKLLDRTGKFLKYVGFGATVLTGVGAIALGVQYVRGNWPYRDVRPNEYVITQNALTEKPARPLRQGVNTYIRPFVRVVEENGRPVTVSGVIQSAETPMFEYRSKEGALVKLKTQYSFQVTTREGAGKVYWDYGGLGKANETLDTIIENSLMNELSKVPAKGVASEERIAEAGEMISTRDGRYVQAKGGEKINYLIEAENKANEILRKERTGVVVTNFAISQPRFSEGVESAWEAPFRAEALKIDEIGRAKARIIKANSEAEEAGILANATKQTFTTYTEIGEETARKYGQRERAIDIALGLHGRDNDQQIVNSGKRIIYVSSGVGGGSSPILINTADLGKVKPKDVKTVN